ncbi:elongation factor G [Deinococcus xinjiangensis]|uniref:Elongation factor G n=1 Tax=Deinococcus xinjiangensis TaxID=457454 RepID=A0ABP9VHF4_9DEIO
MLPLQTIRNIGIAAHVDAGKTTLTERILFLTGRIRKAGDTHHGTTVTDHLAEEQKRGITITSAATYAGWVKDGQEYNLNIIDTPGHVDFTIEVERSMRVLDGAIAVLDASQGVEPQTETVWRQADRYGVPRVVFVNKLDKVGADFQLCLSDLRDKLGVHPLAVQWPLVEDGTLLGAFDLIGGDFLRFADGCRTEPVPPEWQTQYQHARTALLETLAEVNDDLLATYLAGSEPTEAELRQAIRQATLNLQGFPVLCGSALKYQGTETLLDAVVDYLPSPADVPAPTATRENGETMQLKGEVPVALAFKTVADTFGSLTFVRVYSGQLQGGMPLRNTANGERERAATLLRVHANQTEDVPNLSAGEIGAIRGLKHTRTGQTLTAVDAEAIHLESLNIPDPVLSRTLEVGRAEEQPRLLAALLRTVQDDPTLKLSTDSETGLPVLAGMGELHLEVTLERLQRETGLVVRSGEPSVAYAETIRNDATITHLLKKQSGGSGQYAQVELRVAPREAGSGNEIRNAVVGGTIPTQYIPGCLKGIEEALTHGPLGHPVTDLQVTLLGGKAHVKDSSEMAFRSAAADAVREALQTAQPVRLEPVMVVDVTAPECFTGAVVGDLNRRGGQVQGMDSRGNAQVVRGFVPLARLFGYATELRSLTQGRASFSLTPSHYAPVPGA